MKGHMMQMPLLISSLVKHATNYHANTGIYSVESNQSIKRTNWKNIDLEARLLATALTNLGITEFSCCATIAWNNYRHLEIYFAVSGSQRICHTINPRLSIEDLIYIINDANDKVVFFDKAFTPLIEAIKDKVPCVEYFIYMGEHDEEVKKSVDDVLFYDEIIAQQDEDYEWPEFDENSASSLCYTSGTTGKPKGVLYSHRSTVLHSYAISMPDSLNFSAQDIALPVVPMFHVNAWGVPYAAAMCGVSLVLPGQNLDGNSLVKLIDEYKVSVSLGVPTIWQGLLKAAQQTNSQLDSLKRTVVGGSSCPFSMIEEFNEKYHTEVIHAWGMTETSPLGTANQLLAKHKTLSKLEQQKIRATQGRPPFGVELKIVDDDFNDLAHDGETQGRLLIKGPWIVDKYLNNSGSSSDFINGWFDTGDVAVIDEDGFMAIKDRSKDIIKSGGEWISSVNLELIALSHKDISDAAVIGAKHKKWTERPIVIAVKASQASLDEQELLDFYEDKVVKWQIPSKVIFVEDIPRNATGKILKRVLREKYSDVLLDEEDE